MSENTRVSPRVAEIVAGLSAFCDVLESGEPIENHYTVRTVRLDLPEGPCGPDDVKLARKRLGASQAILARFLGVSVKALRSWEQGSRPVPTIARRFLDEIAADPKMFGRRFRSTAVEPARP